MSHLRQNQYDTSRRSITLYSEKQPDGPGYLACGRHRVVTTFQGRLQTYRIATERLFLADRRGVLDSLWRARLQWKVLLPKCSC